MRVLIVGASGQVGKRLAALLRNRGDEVIGTGWTHAGGLVRLDLGDPDGVVRLVREVRPDVVANPGGITAVGECEAMPERAKAVNAEGPEALAEATRESGAYLLHFSTDYVFDGNSGPYSEEDEPVPVGVYARTKREGELRVAAAHSGAAVIRTAVVYGYEEGAKNFLMQVVRAGRAWRGTEGEEPYRAYTDMINSPTHAGNLAEAAMEFLDRREPGLWHVAGAAPVSRHLFATEVLRQFGLPLKAVVPVTMAEHPLPGNRPASVGLEVGRAQAFLSTRLLGAPEGIARARLEAPSV